MQSIDAEEESGVRVVGLYYQLTSAHISSLFLLTSSGFLEKISLSVIPAKKANATTYLKENGRVTYYLMLSGLSEWNS